MHIREFGDFQTPINLVERVLRSLLRSGERWARVLEPTCGRGNFIQGIMSCNLLPKEIIGIEIQDRYLAEARAIPPPPESSISIVKGNVFTIDLQRELRWHRKGPLLVIGNPPWVTNSEIGALEGTNLPQKSNFKGLRGIEAITGQSNFDIAEYIWIKLISELTAERATIALLCKTSVARNVLQYASNAGIDISDATIRLIDAKKWFGASVSACLFTLRTGHSSPSYQAEVFDSLEATSPVKTIGFANGLPVSDIDLYNKVSYIEGVSPFEWRQGIKHDAASVMELVRKEGRWRNSLGEELYIEEEFIYPLVKGSDIRSYDESTRWNRGVIVTQREVGADTMFLKKRAPRLWAYLSAHKQIFDSRKSSVYRNKPPFSIFGVGKYSFADYKVVISGLHKEPMFLAVGPVNGKPLFCDDTCYLLPCRTAVQSATIAALLNHPLCRRFIESIAFKDNKRPITKRVLMRIDLKKIVESISISEVREAIANSLLIMGHREGCTYTPPIDLTSVLELDKRPAQGALFDL